MARIFWISSLWIVDSPAQILKPLRRGRVVAGRDHHPAAPPQGFHRIVESGSGDFSDAQDISAGGQQSFRQRLVIGGGGMPAVMSDDHILNAQPGEIGAAGFSKFANPCFVEIPVNYAANVIGTEDVSGFHGRSFVSL